MEPIEYSKGVCAEAETLMCCNDRAIVFRWQRRVKNSQLGDGVRMCLDMFLFLFFKIIFRINLKISFKNKIINKIGRKFKIEDGANRV